jgi:hypothetical protein
MAYDGRDNRYSIHETETIEQRQQRWMDEHPGEKLSIKRADDTFEAIVWKTARLEATLTRIENALNAVVINCDDIGTDVAEKLGKQLKGQFTVQSNVHYDDHMWVKEQRETEKDKHKKINDTMWDTLKWVLWALTAIIAAATNWKDVFHIK